MPQSVEATKLSLPAVWQRTLDLSSGQAAVQVSYGPDTVDMKVYLRMQDCYPKHRPFKIAGRHQTIKYPVEAIMLSLTLADGTVLQSRACCKPPDRFKESFGLKLALRRLIRLNTAYIKQHGAGKPDKSFPGPQIAQDTALLQALHPDR